MKHVTSHEPELVKDILPRVLAEIRVPGKAPVVVVQLPPRKSEDAA